MGLCVALTGSRRKTGRDFDDINLVVTVMVLIAVLGYAIDGLLFRRLDASVRHKWGLTAAIAK